MSGVRRTCALSACLWVAAGTLSGAAAGPPGAAAAASSADLLAEADRLYWHRHLAGNLDGSLAAAEAVLEQAPRDAAALWRKGRALVRASEREPGRARRRELLDEARRCLELSVEAGPREAQAHYWLGVALGRAGQARGLLRSLFMVGPIRRHMRKALELDPGLGPAHHVLGELARRLPAAAGGSRKKALAEFEAAAAASPNYTVGLVALAEAYLEAREPAKAGAVLRAALALRSPDDPAEHSENMAEARRLLEAIEARQ